MSDNHSVDIAKYSTHKGKIDKEILLRTTFRDKSAPFYRVFMLFWINLFGDSEIAIRTPSLVFGVLSILLIYLITLKFFGRKVAILASVFLCLSPVHIWCSNTSWYYSMALFLILLSIFSYYKSTEGDKANIPWLIAYSISLFLAIFTHWFTVTYLFAISISCLFKINKGKVNILIANLLILACVSVFLFIKFKYGLLAGHIGFLRPLTFFGLWMLFFNWFLFGNSIWSFNPYLANASMFFRNPIMLIVQLCFLLIFLRGIIQILRKPDRRYGMGIIIYLFLLPLLLLGLPYFGIRNIYIERYVIFSLPFFFIILSKGLINFRSKASESMCIIVALLFSLTALVSYFSKTEEWTVFKPTVEWKSAFKYFSEELKDAKEPRPIFLIAGSDYLGGAIYYYELRQKKDLSKDKMVFIYQQSYSKITESVSKVLSSGKFKFFYLISYKCPSCIEYNISSEKDYIFKELLKNIKDDPRASLQTFQTQKMLEIYKFKIN